MFSVNQESRLVPDVGCFSLVNLTPPYLLLLFHGVLHIPLPLLVSNGRGLVSPCGMMRYFHRRGLMRRFRASCVRSRMFDSYSFTTLPLHRSPRRICLSVRDTEQGFHVSSFSFSSSTLANKAPDTTAGVLRDVRRRSQFQSRLSTFSPSRPTVCRLGLLVCLSIILR